MDSESDDDEDVGAMLSLANEELKEEESLSKAISLKSQASPMVAQISSSAIQQSAPKEKPPTFDELINA